jgi:uncharacterized membrane protein YdjX (TVP38/TMEM64 family)
MEYRSRRSGTQVIQETKARRAALTKTALIFLLFVALPLAWQWTPLRDWINVEKIVGWQELAKQYPNPLYLIVGVYLVGSLVLFPITVLNIATILAFGPIMGNIYALIGWIASAAMGFGIGRGFGRNLVHALERSRLKRLIQPAEHHGFLTVLLLRVLPVAPFTLVNFFVGASGIYFWHFILASVVGRIPGIVVLSLAGIQLQGFLRAPELGSFILLALTLTAFPLAMTWLVRRTVSPWQRKTRLSYEEQVPTP